MTETPRASRTDRRRRLLRCLVLLLLASAAATDASVAQVDVTVDPGRTTGAARAVVTIVEFSDYQ